MFLPALACSAAFQAGVVVVYAEVRPVPPPNLWVAIDATGKDTGDALLVSDEHGNKLVSCTAADPLCKVDLARGAIVRIDAMPGQHSTFDGWDGCTPIDQDDVLRCQFTVDDSGTIKAKFGKQPEEADVALVDVPSPPDLVQLPTPPQIPEPPKKKTPEQIEAEKLQEQPVEVALVKPLTPKQLPPPQPPPPPPPPQPPQPNKVEQPPPNMTMVEVPDTNVVDKAPDDATHLSDKNRDVAEETRATDTNLKKEQTGQKADSTPNDNQDDQVGGKDEKIAELEKSQATADKAKDSDHSGASDVSKGAIVGEQGENGEEGTGETKEPGMLSMRGIEGRGNIVDQSGDGHKTGKRGKPGLHTQLDLDAYERIVGKDRAEKERAVARNEQSHHKGRYQKNLDAIKSALENFTPDIRPGNQTALKTRASPFALYIARMHRKIHELWGFGFLNDLDGKPASNPMNNEDLFATIEIALNPDGSVYKMTIAKTSGILDYDVAALHTVQAASPYGQTPEKIRSVDGRVYMRWGFYRNWRQCGTFNVDPYILTSIPGGNVALPSDMDQSDGAVSAADADDDDDLERQPTKKQESGPVHDDGSGGGSGAPTAGSSDDPQVQAAAKAWVAGFASGSVDRMLKVSAIPFYAGTDVAAQTEKDLRSIYSQLVDESGDLKSWQVMTADDYAKKGSPFRLSDGAMVLLVEAKEAFAVVLVPTKSGEYRINAVIR